jgi:hypothetical protein
MKDVQKRGNKMSDEKDYVLADEKGRIGLVHIGDRWYSCDYPRCHGSMAEALCISGGRRNLVGLALGLNGHKLSLVRCLEEDNEHTYSFIMQLCRSMLKSLEEGPSTRIILPQDQMRSVQDMAVTVREVCPDFYDQVMNIMKVHKDALASLS